MLCQSCGFDNPTTESFCRACGVKINYTRDGVAGSLLEKAETRDAVELEEQTRSFLVIAIAFFLVAMTVKVMYGPSTWPRPVEVPASGLTASYAEVRYLRVEQPQRCFVEVPK